MDLEKIKQVLEAHAKWVRGEEGGERAILTRVDLSGVDLTRAILRGAILRRAILTLAILRGAILTNVDLTRAILTGADLSGADLTNTILTNTILSGAGIQMAYGKNICSVSGRQGEEGRMITLLAEGYQSEWIFFCGCFRGTLAELKTWLKENRNGNSYEMKSTMLCVRFLLRLAKMKHS